MYHSTAKKREIDQKMRACKERTEELSPDWVSAEVSKGKKFQEVIHRSLTLTYMAK